MGKNFIIQMENGKPHKRLQHNTSLQPGVPQTVTFSSKVNTPWRLVYHYASVEDEQRAMIPYDQLIYVMNEGP